MFEPQTNPEVLSAHSIRLFGAQLAISRVREHTTGIAMFCLYLYARNSSWLLSIPVPMFTHTRNVTQEVRMQAQHDPALARIAGLDFPAHGVEQ